MERISLTGPGSHELVRKPGVGSCSIGPYGDLEVAPDEHVDWTVFDQFTTPAGSPWPRWIDYEGDDTGWITWAARRPIEGFTWTPYAAHDLDASGADIHGLAVVLRRARLSLTLPAGRFTLGGDLGLFTPRLAPGAECPPLSLHPDTMVAPDRPYALPPLPTLAGATSLAVSVPPLRQPFDCASLLQFPGLTRVELSGSLVGLEALTELKGLTALQLRYAPELPGLAPLDTWPRLTHLIAWNVGEADGKRLRAQLRGTDREWRNSSVSKVRKPEWFTTEYGLPFAGWPSRSARAAVKAFRTAEAAILGATTPAQVEAAVRGFVAAINRLSRIETTEREDAAVAVGLLTAATPLGDLSKAAAAWFDDARDF
ncbi:hypothetical protein JIG36_41335 [Actinoplanes sp. LDG1-06]|uniref:Uncharacterized protein n=1 Tax=Paractinoplanes ovalisporus TaxID=2810368 RepID=A0ABS2AQ71_9ACTN|nr:hypothetical protein [Actinoplanes ovalisporus]MBM2621965.1 hypothetical protein [Actinoplanes ovalisporus]